MSNSPIVDLVLQAGDAGLETTALCRHYRCTPQEIGDEIERLKEAGEIIGFAGVWVAPELVDGLISRSIAALQSLHAAQPSEPLFEPIDVARHAGIKWGAKPMARLLARAAALGVVRERGGRFGLSGQALTIKPAVRVLLDRVKSRLDQTPLGEMNSNALVRELRVPPQTIEEILEIGANAGEVAELAPGFWLTRERLAAIRQDMAEAFGGTAPTVAQLRDHLGASRRIAHAILEADDRL